MRRTCLLFLACAGCTVDPGPPDFDALRQPTGLGLVPGGRWLLVTNGNWDAKEDSATIVALDLERLSNALDAPPSGQPTEDEPCARATDEQVVECDAPSLIDEGATVRLGSGAGMIDFHRPKGEEGPLRLLTTTRVGESTVTWVDYTGFEGDRILADCGQAGDRLCTDPHRVPVPGDASQVMVDEEGFPFAYLPHLLGLRLTLLALDGDRGPEVTDVEEEFFTADALHETDLGGGFAVAQRACDVDSGNVPALSNECTRPYLYATHRHWWGVRTFRVAPGLEVVLPGGNYTVIASNIEATEPKPLMGELEFEDPAGDRLLIVGTSPPTLSRMDTTLDRAGNPRNQLLVSTPVCENPNQLAVHRATDADSLAFVACYGTGEVAVVSLTTFTLVANLVVGEGANELVVDEARQVLYCANTGENTISVIELDITSPDYLREIAMVR